MFNNVKTQAEANENHFLHLLLDAALYGDSRSVELSCSEDKAHLSILDERNSTSYLVGSFDKNIFIRMLLSPANLLKYRLESDPTGTAFRIVHNNTALTNVTELRTILLPEPEPEPELKPEPQVVATTETTNYNSMWYLEDLGIFAERVKDEREISRKTPLGLISRVIDDVYYPLSIRVNFKNMYVLLRLLIEKPLLTVQDICNILKLSRAQVTRYCNILVYTGHIKMDKSNPRLFKLEYLGDVGNIDTTVFCKEIATDVEQAISDKLYITDHDLENSVPSYKEFRDRLSAVGRDVILALVAIGKISIINLNEELTGRLGKNCVYTTKTDPSGMFEVYKQVAVRNTYTTTINNIIQYHIDLYNGKQVEDIYKDTFTRYCAEFLVGSRVLEMSDGVYTLTDIGRHPSTVRYYTYVNELGDCENNTEETHVETIKLPTINEVVGSTTRTELDADKVYGRIMYILEQPIHISDGGRILLERLRDTILFVKEHIGCTINDVAKHTDCSTSTIHRAMDLLTNCGSIVAYKTPGGSLTKHVHISDKHKVVAAHKITVTALKGEKLLSFASDILKHMEVNKVTYMEDLRSSMITPSTAIDSLCFLLCTGKISAVYHRDELLRSHRYVLGELTHDEKVIKAAELNVYDTFAERLLKIIDVFKLNNNKPMSFIELADNGLAFMLDKNERALLFGYLLKTDLLRLYAAENKANYYVLTAGSYDQVNLNMLVARSADARVNKAKIITPITQPLPPMEEKEVQDEIVLTSVVKKYPIYAGYKHEDLPVITSLSKMGKLYKRNSNIFMKLNEILHGNDNTKIDSIPSRINALRDLFEMDKLNYKSTTKNTLVPRVELVFSVENSGHFVQLIPSWYDHSDESSTLATLSGTNIPYIKLKISHNVIAGSLITKDTDLAGMVIAAMDMYRVHGKLHRVDHKAIVTFK